MNNLIDLNQIIYDYRKIIEEYVKPRLEFYKERVDSKRRCALAVRWVVLMLSLSIPLVGALGFTVFDLPNTFIVSLMSLLIAVATGLEGIHQWQHTWKEYSERIVQIETRMGLWEVQLAKASMVKDANEFSSLLAQSTENLLTGVEVAVSAEMQSFFSAIPKLPAAPQAKTQ